ncbi:biofilm development regulator YmgB/AriR family protein [Superficieibacter sp. HKU1]|uniref:biofilm development regulator YmgB/AriR family protein n=1 Tax=Superficieibacter sp. HKU1 TaxID=3031919 RepID=UPI0023E2BA73|nr:biofilm development regulator YmgB/AriR family protein [Superficieibacter sp. HKU1]WES70656.1 biofilm development regulator YmgB/AriR family protein [Superficieibacter sp. HKU1]
MLQERESYDDLPSLALTQYFRTAGDRLVEESAMLGAAIRSIMDSQGELSNKAIIQKLISFLETNNDVVTGDIIRKTLEIIVDHTMDDL